MPVQPREALEKEFFSRIPKARKINPQYRGFFDLMYQAHEAARPGKRLPGPFERLVATPHCLQYRLPIRPEPAAERPSLAT